MLLFKLQKKFIFYFWLLLTFLLLAGGGDVANGQVRTYATLSTQGGTGTVTGLTNVRGASTTTPPAGSTPANLSATGTTGALGGSAVSVYINLQFASNVPSNTVVFIKVSAITLPSIASSVTAVAYNNSTAATGSTFYNLVAGDGTQYIGVYATSIFNQVRLTVTGAGGGLLNAPAETAGANVFYAFYSATNTADCGSPIGTSWSGNGTVVNSGNAIDGNLATYSDITPSLLLSTVEQSFYFSGLSVTNDEVKATLSIPPSVLSLGLLSNITVNAYNGSNTAPVWTTNLGAVLSLDLLGLFNTGTPITVAVKPSLPFDRLSINYSAVLGLLVTLHVHEIQRTSASPIFTVQNTAICTNSTATLIANAPAGNQTLWYNDSAALLFTGNSFTTPTLSATTTYYAATAKIGCPGESLRLPAVVTVNALPTVAPITGNTSICLNQSSTLSNSTTGGVWSSSDPNIVTINSSTGAVSPLASGTSTITYTYTDPTTTCPNSVTTSLTVKPLPVLTSSLTPAVCSNTVFSYSATSSITSASFSWTRATVAGISNASGSGATNAISETLINTTNAPLTVTYIFSLTANGCSNTVNVQLKVNPKPGAPHILSQ